MKRLTLTLAVATAIAASCSRIEPTTTAEAQEDPQLVEVTFNLSGVRTGDLTRAATNADIADAIAATLPTDITLTLTHLTKGGEYSVALGEKVVLPVGAYSVVYRHRPTPTAYINGSANYTTAAPVFDISQEIEVEAGVSDYSVTAQYDCFAVAADASVTAKVLYYDGNGTEQILRFKESGDVLLIFAHGDWTPSPLRLVYIPLDETRYERTTFDLYTTKADANAYGGIFAQPSKWYWFSPGAATTMQSGMFVDYPAWTSGL